MTTQTPTESKPKELVRPMPLMWWLKQPSYFWFMVRDVTSIFIAGYCVFLLVLMARAAGSDDFAAFHESLQSPLSVVLHIIALTFAVFHSVTFFNLTPRVMVLFRGEEKVPEKMISGAHYAAWAVVSLVMLVIALLV